MAIEVHSLKTNSKRLWKQVIPKGKSSSNHWFSEVMLVSGRVYPKTCHLNQTQTKRVRKYGFCTLLFTARSHDSEPPPNKSHPKKKLIAGVYIRNPIHNGWFLDFILPYCLNRRYTIFLVSSRKDKPNRDLKILLKYTKVTLGTKM